MGTSIVKQHKILILALSVTLMSLKPILLHGAQGGGALDPKVFLLATELLKFGIAGVAVVGRRFVCGSDTGGRCWLGAQHSIRFILPAATYLVMNGATVYANSVIRPATFQLLANMKIITTAVAGVLVLSRSYKWSQWLAMVLLMISTVVGQSTNGQSSVDATAFAFLIVLFCVCLSAVGSVLTERLLKDNDTKDLSIFAMNMHMAGHTILLNVAALLLTSGRGLPAIPDMTSFLFAAMLNEAINGMVLSSIMRLADSNVKNYAFSLSVFTTAGSSAFAFGYLPGPGFFASAALVILSMALYTKAPSLPWEAQQS